ncbi:MAG: succinate dehydrogenase [Kiloniellaceae bacterium]
MIRPHQNHPAYWAFVLHRISGVALALFLPAHFLVLGLAIESEAALDGFLRWSETPLARTAETGLVILLAVHLTGGLRLLMVEFLPWRDWQKPLIGLAAALPLVVGVLFLFSAV